MDCIVLASSDNTGIHVGRHVKDGYMFFAQIFFLLFRQGSNQLV